MIQLELYLKEIFNFLRTLTIKNEFFANQMYDTWVSDEYKDKLPYYLHPYYRNITGDYILFDYRTLEEAYGIYKERLTAEEYKTKFKEVIQPLVEEYNLSVTSKVITDQGSYDIPNSVIYTKCNELPIINSFDTQEKIPFTKALLSGTTKHITTAEIYKIPNTRYYKLLEKYPSSSDIIKAIVYPILATETESAYDRAYNAKNFELLAYDESMLEQQERQTIYECVSNALDVVRKRYAIKEYCFEKLYPQAMQYLLWQILYLAVFVQRISNIKSGSVHTYHLWSYLKSHGLGEYRDILSVRQQQFLYRNIEYLIHHKGTQYAMEILIYVLLTCENITLQGKNTKQMLISDDKLSNILDTTQKQPSFQSITVARKMLAGIASMYKENPNARFDRIIEYMGANAGQNNENDQQEYQAGYSETTETIYKKERDEGIEYQDDYRYNKSTKHCDYLISTSPISHRNTKLLELTNSATADLYVQLYTKFVAESLMYRLARGKLNFSVTFSAPESVKNIVLPAKDLIGVLFYILNRSNKNVLGDEFEHNVLFTSPAGVDSPSITGQATDKFEDNKRKLWTKGTRIYDDWTLENRPPNMFYVEWPYLCDQEGGELTDNGFAPLPEDFYWRKSKYKLFGYLENVTTVYRFTINKQKITFTLKDKSVEAISRVYVSGDRDYTIEYNSGKSRWLILNSEDIAVYQSEQTSLFTTKLEHLRWMDMLENEKYFDVTIMDRVYTIDANMYAYRPAFSNASKMSSAIHNQAMDFINMYLENAQSGSAIRNELYRTILSNRCFKGEVYIQFFGGKSFNEYLASDDENVSILRDVCNTYDHSENPSLAYGKFVDSIVNALFPEEEALLSSLSTVISNKYNKLIKLFKSLLPYNLAFISSEYQDVTSTLLPNLKSDTYVLLGQQEFHENDLWIDDCRTKIHDLNKPGYVNQNQVVKWNGIDSRHTVDMQLKKIILDNAKEIEKVLTTNYNTSIKTARIIKLLHTPSYYLTTDATFQKGVNNYLSNNQVHVTDRYYTRSGTGCISDPYIYTPADVIKGNAIPDNTYYTPSSNKGRDVITPHRFTDDVFYQRDKEYFFKDTFVLETVTPGAAVAANTYYEEKIKDGTYLLLTLTDDVVFLRNKNYYTRSEGGTYTAYSPLTVTPGTVVPIDSVYDYQVARGEYSIYILTTDTKFIKNKYYYTRTGSGTLASPYVYKKAKVTTGATITANTYYDTPLVNLIMSMKEEDLINLRFVNAKVGSEAPNDVTSSKDSEELITHEEGGVTIPGYWNEKTIDIGRDATDAEIANFERGLNLNRI